MILHAAQGFRGTIIDLDTGKRVPKVIWFDDERGILEAYETDGNGNLVLDGPGEYRTYQAKGRFCYLPETSSEHKTTVKTSHDGTRREVPSASVDKELARGLVPACARCLFKMTLPGDALCPTCRAKERTQKNPMLPAKPISPLEIQWCSYKGCGRRALWAVSDEVAVTPISIQGTYRTFGKLIRNPVFTRAMTVGRRHYCSFHFKPPRILDAKGEIIEELEEAGGVRPQ